MLGFAVDVATLADAVLVSDVTDDATDDVDDTTDDTTELVDVASVVGLANDIFDFIPNHNVRSVISLCT